MSRICEICQKKPVMGRSIARRGLPKKTGGIGLKTTGIVKRRFLPNLRKIRAFINGGARTMRVCWKCIKAGKIQKAPRRHYSPSPS